MKKLLFPLFLLLFPGLGMAEVSIGYFDIQYSRPGSFQIRYFVCNEEVDKPASGLNVGDRAYVLDTQKVYVATSTTGWADLTPGSGQTMKFDGLVWRPTDDGMGNHTATMTLAAPYGVNAATLTVTGESVFQSTMTVSTLTWTNGTVQHRAAGYALGVQALTSSPADGQTIYFGQLPKAPVTAAATSKIYIPRNGTIKRAYIYCYSGTAGTAENWSIYIRANNTTDTLIETIGASASERIFNNEALSIAVTTADYIEIKGVQPTWATNPLTTIYGGYLYIE